MVRRKLFWSLFYQPVRNYARSLLVTEATESRPVIPTFRLAAQWPDRTAITDEFGDYTYRNLFFASKKLAARLTDILDGKTQERIAFLCPSNAKYVIAQWACWMSGNIAIPLSSAHPQEMLEYFVNDSDSCMILGTENFKDRIELLSKKTGAKTMILNNLPEDTLNEKHEKGSSGMKGGCNPNLYTKWNALIIYTSGSTAMPKGVVLSFSNLSSQVNSMISAWHWSAKDTVLHTLPLHHIHGVVNGLMTPLHCGARCVFLPKFNASEIWNHLLAIKVGTARRVTVFTGVPTMYVKLIEEFENSLSKNDRMANYVKATCSQKMRLMMCGSAPLPDTTFDEWERITGHRLLERYGMSEIGMALTNPYKGSRKPGFVGTPLPNVSVRIVDNDKTLLEGTEFCSKILTKNVSDKDKLIGELQVRGDNVFKEYWHKPEVTKQAFTDDGWFRTGDIVQYVENSYRILGRSSVDIIKSGGYKISALFVESILLQSPSIKDITVVGLPDPTWGQQVVALCVLVDPSPNTITSIKSWAVNKLPSYSLPSVWKIVPEIPRNVMGKINKKQIINELMREKKNVNYAQLK